MNAKNVSGVGCVTNVWVVDDVDVVGMRTVSFFLRGQMQRINSSREFRE